MFVWAEERQESPSWPLGGIVTAQNAYFTPSKPGLHKSNYHLFHLQNK